MIVLVLRCVLAGLFLVTIASRLQSWSAAPSDGPSAVSAFLERQGLPVHANLLQGAQHTIVFSAPGCDRPLKVQTMNTSLDAVPLFEAAADRSDAKHYIYMGEIRPTVEPVALRVKWIKYQVLAMLGLAPYRLLRTVLFVAEPAGCDAVKRIDWRPIWKTAAI
jgi:hypothetical protein